MIPPVLPTGSRSEHSAGLAEARDDFIEDQDDVVAVADLTKDLEVLRGGCDDPAGVTDRLHDHAGHRLGIFVDDDVLHRPGGEAVALVPSGELVTVVSRREDL